MRLTRHRRWMAPVVAAAAVGLALTACTGDVAEEDAADVDCGAYEEYGTFDGAEVTASGTILDLEADRLNESWADFETCTGISVEYQGSSEFEAQIAVLAEGGNATDVAFVPQPGLMNRLAAGGWLIPASEAVEANVDEFWSEDWKAYGTYEDTFYGAPLMASIKGYVWYSPTEFEEKGYEIPTTLDELKELSDTIAAEGDHKPWCVGLESGEATGWPGTDWVEDYMLRLNGAEAYDQWVTHEIPFNDPQVADAFDAVGQYLKSEDMVNGGIGDVSTQVTEAFQTAGLPILDGDVLAAPPGLVLRDLLEPRGRRRGVGVLRRRRLRLPAPAGQRRGPAVGHRRRRDRRGVPRSRGGRGVPRLPVERHLGEQPREPGRRDQREQGRRPRERVERAARAVDRDPAGSRDHVPVRRVRPDARCRRRRLLLEGHRGLGRR